MELIRLKNGSEEADVLVYSAMGSLKVLADDQPNALYELVMKCRDNNHVFFGDTGNILKERHLIEPDGRVHDSLRNIVLSAVVGDGLEMCLQSPLEK